MSFESAHRMDLQVAEKKQIPGPTEYASKLREHGMEDYAAAYEQVVSLAQSIQTCGGTALLVGGSVRDMVMGMVPKDFDLEVYGLPPDEVEKIVTASGKVSEVGKAFGILKIHLESGLDIDVSMPRTDSKIEGSDEHSGFHVKTDHNMSVQEAAKRRDFTMNSVAANPLTGELHDPYNGVEDIQNRILRVTDPERFQDDPLRVLRGVQFIGRFGLEVDMNTAVLMQEMAPRVKNMSRERILEEWKKLLTKSPKPSLGLTAAMTLGILREIHPQLPPLRETQQELAWHPEGDVWIHTLMVIDEAAKITVRENLDSKKSFTLLLSSLCHDLGKPATTETKDGKITSIAHEPAGAEPTLQFLETLGTDNLTRDKIVKLVVNHMAPTSLYISEAIHKDKISDGAIRKLAARLHPATIQELVLLCEADHLGRGEFSPEQRETLLLSPTEYAPGPWLLERARKIAVEDSKPEPMTRGRDWIAFGFNPGKELGRLIKLADELRDEKGYTREMVFQSVEGITEVNDAIKKLESLFQS